MTQPYKLSTNYKIKASTKITNCWKCAKQILVGGQYAKYKHNSSKEIIKLCLDCYSQLGD